ncbi:MAG: VIT1/CCC1 family protein, partial [Bacillota bacterium]
MGQSISKETIDRLLVFQENEITEYHIYNNLSKMVNDQGNKELLQRIARDEKAHYDFYSKYTQREVKPNRWRVFLYTWIARIFGLTFGLKLMEAGESRAHSDYSEAAKEIPEVSRIAEEEDKHEHELLDLIEEDRLNYISSIVLGLNDALVELTGTLAGLTFALQNTRLIALA